MCNCNALNLSYNVGAFKWWSEHEEEKKRRGKKEGRERKGGERKGGEKKGEKKREEKKDASPRIEPRTFQVVGQSSNCELSRRLVRHVQ